MEYSLEQSELRVVVSLSSVDDGETNINIAFDESVGARELGELAADNDQLATLEHQLFDAEVYMYAPSPRQIQVDLPTEDLEDTVVWVREMIEVLDETYMKINRTQREFDSLLEERLNSK